MWRQFYQAIDTTWPLIALSCFIGAFMMVVLKVLLRSDASALEMSAAARLPLETESSTPRQERTDVTV